MGRSVLVASRRWIQFPAGEIATHTLLNTGGRCEAFFFMLDKLETLSCSVIFGTPTTPVFSCKQQTLALSGSSQTLRLLSVIGLTAINFFYAKHIASIQSLSSHRLPTNARCFLQMRLTVALGHRFKIYTAKFRGGIYFTDPGPFI